MFNNNKYTTLKKHKKTFFKIYKNHKNMFVKLLLKKNTNNVFYIYEKS